MTNYEIFTKYDSTALLACFILTIYEAIFPEKKKVIGITEIYGYSAIEFFVSLIFLFLLALTGVVNIKVIPDIPTATLFLFIYSLPISYCVYVFKYKVVIENGNVIYGALQKKKFLMSQIRSASVTSNGRRRFLVVSLCPGESITFSSTLTSFNDLCEKFKSQAARNGFAKNA